MLKLGKHNANLTADDSDGWAPAPGGVIFNFKDGASVYVSDEMADKIHATFEHKRKYERPSTHSRKAGNGG